MATKKTDPLKSEGARAERKAMRSYLRRKINKGNLDAAAVELEAVLDWVITRQDRYDKRPGGL